MREFEIFMRKNLSMTDAFITHGETRCFDEKREEKYLCCGINSLVIQKWEACDMSR